MDPFASVELECGKISDSQESHLRRRPFLLNPSTSAEFRPYTPSDGIFLPSSSDEAESNTRLVAADYPGGIFMRSVSNSPSSTGAGGEVVVGEDERGSVAKSELVEQGSPIRREPMGAENAQMVNDKLPVEKSSGISLRKKTIRWKVGDKKGRRSSLGKSPGARIVNTQDEDPSLRASPRACSSTGKDLLLKTGNGDFAICKGKEPLLFLLKKKKKEPLLPVREGSGKKRPHDNGGEEDGAQLVNDPFEKFRYVKTGYHPKSLQPEPHNDDAGVHAEKEDGAHLVHDPLEKFRYVKTGYRPKCSQSELHKEDAGVEKSVSVSEGVAVLRKLPASIRSLTCISTVPQSPLPENDHDQPQPENDQNTNKEKVADSVFPSNIFDVVKAFSRKPDRTVENVDILDISAMKGIHFPLPQWWRPGGYAVTVGSLTGFYFVCKQFENVNM